MCSSRWNVGLTEQIDKQNSNKAIKKQESLASTSQKATNDGNYG